MCNIVLCLMVFVFVLYFCMVCLCFMDNKNMKNKKKKKNISRHTVTGFMNCDILKQNNSRGNMKGNGAVKTQPVIIVDTGL